MRKEQEIKYITGPQYPKNPSLGKLAMSEPASPEGVPLNDDHQDNGNFKVGKITGFDKLAPTSHHLWFVSNGKSKG